MVIGRILSPVHSLGPGERVAVWTKGCSRGCEGCISPELQSFSGDETDEAALAGIVKHVAAVKGCNGLTVSGGDPFEQSGALYRFLERVRDSFEDILVYTGYSLQEIEEGGAGAAGEKCLGLIDVLIDGPYIAALNRPDCVLRGSSNQVIHFRDPEK